MLTRTAIPSMEAHLLLSVLAVMLTEVQLQK